LTAGLQDTGGGSTGQGLLAGAHAGEVGGGALGGGRDSGLDGGQSAARDAGERAGISLSRDNGSGGSNDDSGGLHVCVCVRVLACCKR